MAYIELRLQLAFSSRTPLLPTCPDGGQCHGQHGGKAWEAIEGENGAWRRAWVDEMADRAKWRKLA